MTEQQERALREGLSALASTTVHASASPAVEAAVLQAMAARATAGAANERPTLTVSADDRPGPRWFSVAAAAALLVLSLSGAWIAKLARTPAGPIQPKGFMALPGSAILPPIESASIVQVMLPISALPQYGLPITPEISADAVEAELLIAQDGLPRAIRLVDDWNGSRSTP